MNEDNTSARPPGVRATAGQYRAATAGAGLLDRSIRGRIGVRGTDRASYLHGILTNDILSLGAGNGCYAAYLTAQGRMIADMEVLNLGDELLLNVHPTVRETLVARLDQFVFAEDVQLEDLTPRLMQFAVHGPESTRIIETALHGPAGLSGQLARFREYQSGEWRLGEERVLIVRTERLGGMGFDLYIDQVPAPVLWDALRSAGAEPIDASTADVLRIEAGRPEFTVDMDENTIPLEAGIEDRAISMTKGCYVGQEVIVRVLHRGHGRVARRLIGLRVMVPEDVSDPADAVPVAGARVFAGDEVGRSETRSRAESAVVQGVSPAVREIGGVTSATWSPALEQPIVLAYVHRDFVAPGTEVQVDTAGGLCRAVVTPLPFRK
jgi:tRNA-modifying protein YgfZ